MTIRTATAADLPALVTMGRRFRDESAYRDYLAEVPEDVATKLGQLLLGDAGTILVLEQDDRLIGMLALFCHAHFLSGERFAGEVVWWVDPEHRGAGLKLWRAAEQWAKAQGARTLQMIAPNARVEQLYERRGYVPLERTYYKRLDDGA